MNESWEYGTQRNIEKCWIRSQSLYPKHVKTIQQAIGLLNSNTSYNQNLSSDVNVNHESLLLSQTYTEKEFGEISDAHVENLYYKYQTLHLLSLFPSLLNAIRQNSFQVLWNHPPPKMRFLYTRSLWKKYSITQKRALMSNNDDKHDSQVYRNDFIQQCISSIENLILKSDEVSDDP